MCFFFTLLPSDTHKDVSCGTDIIQVVSSAGLFLITAGIERPEMVEVLAISKEERNVWRAVIQEAMHFM